MKACTLLMLLCFCIALSYGQAINRPQYPLKFRCYNNGVSKDTMLTRMGYKIWSKSGNYPEYVKWKNLPFAVLHSPLNGVGLFTDSTTSYTSGQTIGYGFFKVSSTGKFETDYLETNIGSFVNDADTPNMQVILTADGIILKANQSIGPNTELTASYQDIINLFPNDPTVKKAIQYW